ncbi:hypothetical protein EMCRGX_G003690 [Ephydatia muelleri]
MKTSLHWTVALYLALSTICVSVNRLCAECIEVFPEMVPMESEVLCKAIAYRQCSAANINKTLLPTSPALVRSGNQIALISGKTDYTLSFDIVPIGTATGDHASILHFTTGTNCCNFGSRSPAIWFNPGSTSLYVRIGDSTDGDWGFYRTDALPLNISTKVTLECNQRGVKLTVGTRVYTATQPTYRFAGNLIVYAGDPWYQAAKAIISNLDYEILAYRQCSAANINKTLLPTSPALVRSGNQIALISGKTDYTLSFDIVPIGTATGDHASILHFTTGTNCCNFGSRSPAIWFNPGSTSLYVRIGDSTDGDWGFYRTDALPLNISTKVTLECNQRGVKLTVGTRVYTATQPTYRFAGNLIVYAGDPWYQAAKAIISNLDYEILGKTSK